MRYVYVIRCNDNFYKIGIATDVKRRIESMQVGNPYQLELVACYELNEKSGLAETAIHQMLRFFMPDKYVRYIRGEWFWISETALPLILQQLEIRENYYAEHSDND